MAKPNPSPATRFKTENRANPAGRPRKYRAPTPEECYQAEQAAKASVRPVELSEARQALPGRPGFGDSPEPVLDLPPEQTLDLPPEQTLDLPAEPILDLPPEPAAMPADLHDVVLEPETVLVEATFDPDIDFLSYIASLDPGGSRSRR